MSTQNEHDIKAKAAAFDRLVAHLQERKDVQNIDLMDLAGFCRNCLSRWYMEEDHLLGGALDKEEARTRVYGMAYDEWKKLYQTERS
ncbi:MAG: DUF1244 domain-containing protein [Alphaproteobacteria bacterium]|jgi:hypothetical protein|nr:DUF1244 domain-containing protein [Alphaproteobacteria bacterium]